ncbi:hypothetical protein [Umezakia ovalisporum]|jgi:hypothetical protein|uniref:hypothetical protein n=1 Tax=Umezakia ovalisporum TaxID=75695 RepID=UPI002473865F|nr:hypothetical protein [Umezakia ovalisporum]MBI1240418.1 hypothetical protein [Nostoc sp. RI_552]MDH6087099.1 hypothetical protein [Umezakia ovalisporum Ak1311]
MSDFPQQHQQLKIQKRILQCEDDLVIWIQDALDKTNYGDLEESQFRNLLRVADTTDSAEVIKNFIRYQVGRDKKWGRGKDSLAEKIILHIDNDIKKASQKIAGDYQAEYKPIWLELIRRYLGYGARHLKYKREGAA